MGYTHYWNFKMNPKDIKGGAEKFKKATDMALECIKKVPKEIENEPFRLAGGDGKGEPVINEHLVWFNGAEKDGNDYETFCISLDYSDYKFDFCKTARKPYDVAVCIMLLCFKEAFGRNFQYSSDGTAEDYGWAKAHEIFNEVKGKEAS